MRNLPALFLLLASRFFAELEKCLSNLAEAKGVAV
jgi:hypothetical protein